MQSGASETAQSPRNSSGTAGPETAPIQADGGDNRKTVCHEKVAVEDISDEQSDEQPSLPMQPASSESSESGATEQEFPESPRSTSLDLPEEIIEVSRISRQGGVRPTPSICDNSSTRICRSPSVGILEGALGPKRASQTEDVSIEGIRHVIRRASDTIALGPKAEEVEVGTTPMLVGHPPPLALSNPGCLLDKVAVVAVIRSLISHQFLQTHRSVSPTTRPP